MSKSKPSAAATSLEDTLRAYIPEIVGNTTAVELADKIKELYLLDNTTPPEEITPARIATLLASLARESKVINLVEEARDGDNTKDVYAPYQDPDVVR
jgi:hypothetical protein